MNIRDIDNKIANLQTPYQNKKDREYKAYIGEEYLLIKELTRLLVEYRKNRDDWTERDEFDIKFRQKFEPWGRASETFEDIWTIEFLNIFNCDIYKGTSLDANLSFTGHTFLEVINIAKYFFIKYNEENNRK